MVATVDILHPDRPKRVLIVASNPTVSPVTGWPVGFWWSELTHPWWELTAHGYRVLLTARRADGGLVVDGTTWTGFANAEEQFADEYVGRRIQPFWIEDEARKLPGTNFIVDGRFKPHAVRDGNLITGQQQYSGVAAARLMITALGV